MPTLDFASLIPSHHTFRLDGQVYEFRSQVDFGAVDYARLNRFQREMKESLARLEQAGEDESAAEQLEQVMREIVMLILPTLPVQAVDTMTLGQKMGITQWWGEQDRREAGPAPVEGAGMSESAEESEAGKAAAR